MHNRTLFCFTCVVLSVIALSLLFSASLLAQDTPDLQTTAGTEFWIAFQKNFRDFVEEGGNGSLKPAEPLQQGLTICSEQSASGYVEVPGIGFRQEFTLEPKKPIRIFLDPMVQITKDEIPVQLGVHVVADNPVTVVSTSHRYQTTDSYLNFPVNVLGTRYRVMGYKWLASDLLSQFAFVATEDHTTVTIVPSVKTASGKEAEQPHTVTLDKGEVYQVLPEFNPSASSDLTGSLIESDKPLAVFSGHNCAYVPTNRYKACNILIEQLPPTDSWGTRFVAVPLSERNSYVLRILADRQGTIVSVNGKQVATLGAGDFYEMIDVKENVEIVASLPVMVAQYSTGFTYNSAVAGEADSVGDPMMVLVPPTNSFLSLYNVVIPFDGSWANYVNIVIPVTGRESLRIDGKPVDLTKFVQIPSSRFVAASFELEGGTHRLEASKPFGVIQYGFGYERKIYDAYGNVGGMGFPARTIAPKEAEKVTDKPVQLKQTESDRPVEIEVRKTDAPIDKSGIER